MTEGLKTQDGLVRAYDEWVLVSPYNNSSDIVVVQFDAGEPQKGTVIDVGQCVPDPINPGDLVYFTCPLRLEKDLLSVHFHNIMAFSKLVDD